MEPGGPRVLLVKRGRAPSKGMWSLPGGRLERGERIVDAVAREVREETGLEVAVHELVEVVELVQPEYHYVILDHRCERTGGTLAAGDDAEDVALAPVSDLDRYAVSEAVSRVVRRALAAVRP
jgi:ADP-ribose pyrophosphatase YjhB (NUDIX family)